MSLEELFEKHSDEYLKFNKIKKADRRHHRPDLCAFLYLDEKLGGDGDVVGSASHDEIGLDFENLERLTEEDVIYIIRCGICYNRSDEYLYSFV